MRIQPTGETLNYLEQLGVTHVEVQRSSEELRLLNSRLSTASTVKAAASCRSPAPTPHAAKLAGILVRPRSQNRDPQRGVAKFPAKPATQSPAPMISGTAESAPGSASTAAPHAGSRSASAPAPEVSVAVNTPQPVPRKDGAAKTWITMASALLVGIGAYLARLLLVLALTATLLSAPSRVSAQVFPPSVSRRPDAPPLPIDVSDGSILGHDSNAIQGVTNITRTPAPPRPHSVTRQHRQPHTAPVNPATGTRYHPPSDSKIPRSAEVTSPSDGRELQLASDAMDRLSLAGVTHQKSAPLVEQTHQLDTGSFNLQRYIDDDAPVAVSGDATVAGRPGEFETPTRPGHVTSVNGKINVATMLATGCAFLLIGLIVTRRLKEEQDRKSVQHVCDVYVDTTQQSPFRNGDLDRRNILKTDSRASTETSFADSAMIDVLPSVSPRNVMHNDSYVTDRRLSGEADSRHKRCETSGPIEEQTPTCSAGERADMAVGASCVDLEEHVRQIQSDQARNRCCKQTAENLLIPGDPKKAFAIATKVKVAAAPAALHTPAPEPEELEDSGFPDRKVMLTPAAAQMKLATELEDGERCAVFSIQTQPQLDSWTYGATSICGPVRKQNQDCCRVVEIDGYRAAIVADGCGGVPEGARAARLAVEGAFAELVAVLRSDMQEPLAAVAASIQAASQCVNRFAAAHDRRKGLQTTLIVAIASESKYYLGYLGDGGCCLLREDGSLERLLSAQRVGNSNQITGCLGPQQIGQPEFVTKERLPGDLFVVGSDGVFDYIGDERPFMLNLLSQSVLHKGDLQQTVKTVIDRLAEEEDEIGFICEDNLTLAVIGNGRPDVVPKLWKELEE